MGGLGTGVTMDKKGSLICSVRLPIPSSADQEATVYALLSVYHDGQYNATGGRVTCGIIVGPATLTH